MTRPRLILADDHAETRALLSRLLETEFDIVAEVEDGCALVDSAEELSPDVIVTDISMPRLDGIAAAVSILASNPDARIVIVSMHGDLSMVRCGMSAGVLGYVLKISAGEELVPAVHAALSGRQHISKSLGYGNSQ